MAEKKYSTDGQTVNVHGGTVGGKKKLTMKEFEDAMFLPYQTLEGQRFEKPPSGGSTNVGLDASELRGGRGKVNPEKGKDFAKGGVTASCRADGIAQRGKTRGKMC